MLTILYLLEGSFASFELLSLFSLEVPRTYLISLTFAKVHIAMERKKRESAKEEIVLVPNLRTTFAYQPSSSVETERGLVTKVPPDSLIYHYKTTIFKKKKTSIIILLYGIQPYY